MKPDIENPLLARFAECFTALQWPSMIVDADWKLVWVSDQIRKFVRAPDDADLGHGLHIAEALLKEDWLSALAPESLPTLFADVGPYLLGELERQGRRLEDVMPPELIWLFEGVEPKPVPDVFQTRFLAIDPDAPDLRPHPVSGCAFRVRDEQANTAGWVIINFLAVQPNLLVLLARGDEEMYERMARLIDPGPRQAAILFCDLQSSGSLSRQLPSLNYFRLVRQLWTDIDDAVAANDGIVGKHAGDGASAYFLVDDLGSASNAALAALRTATRVHQVSQEVFVEAVDEGCPMRVGLHWGGSLYMGQLVPGSRLDVAALGDAVNETARIQEAARGGETLASKQLLEQLEADDAASVGVDLGKISYRTLGEVAPEATKVVRDAGGLPVTSL